MQFMARWSRFLIVAAALAATGCPPSEPGTAEKQEATDGASLAEIRAELKDLESRFGMDSYDRPEALVLLKKLEKIPESSPDSEEAHKLAAWLRAKQKIAYQAKSEEKTDTQPETIPKFGALPMEGPAPEKQDEVKRAEGLGVGTSREELVTTYGSCLIRQTWFQAKPGVAATELFHVAPPCREKLTPRVFTVRSDEVIEVNPGHLDRVMTTQSGRGDERPVPASSDEQ